MTGDDIVAAARAYLGTPFQHQGRQKGIGVDCAGLVLGTAHDLAMTDFAVSAYSRVSTDNEVMRVFTEELHMTPIAFADAQAGDVLHIVFMVDNKPQHHTAIATGEGTMIHAYSLSPHKVIEHRIDALWRSRIRGAYRFPGVEA